MQGITVERLGRDDLKDVFRLWSDFEAVRMTNWAHTPTLEACRERLEKVLARYASDTRHFGPFVVREEGRFVGLVGADAWDEGDYEVWYAFVRAEWGKGFATRALPWLLARMEASGRVQRIAATAVVDNVASWKLLEKNGFRRERTISGGHTAHGEALDLYVYKR